MLLLSITGDDGWMVGCGGGWILISGERKIGQMGLVMIKLVSFHFQLIINCCVTLFYQEKRKVEIMGCPNLGIQLMTSGNIWIYVLSSSKMKSFMKPWTYFSCKSILSWIVTRRKFSLKGAISVFRLWFCIGFVHLLVVCMAMLSLVKMVEQSIAFIGRV